MEGVVFVICSDVEHRFFEVTTSDKRFSDYPGAAFGRCGKPYVELTNRNWYKQLEDIASWVNNELNEACFFTLG